MVILTDLRVFGNSIAAANLRAFCTVFENALHGDANTDAFLNFSTLPQIWFLAPPPTVLEWLLAMPLCTVT